MFIKSTNYVCQPNASLVSLTIKVHKTCFVKIQHCKYNTETVSLRKFNELQVKCIFTFRSPFCGTLVQKFHFVYCGTTRRQRCSSSARRVFFIVQRDHPRKVPRIAFEPVYAGQRTVKRSVRLGWKKKQTYYYNELRKKWIAIGSRPQQKQALAWSCKIEGHNLRRQL